MSDPAVLTFTGQATRGDAIRTTVELMRASRSSTIVGSAAMTVVIVGFLAGVPFDLSSVFLFAFGALFLTGFFVVPFQWWAISRRPDLMTAPMTVEAGPASLRIAMSAASSDLGWSTFKSFLETSDSFLLQTGITAHFVPKRGVSDADRRAFRLILGEHGELRHAGDLGRWGRHALTGVAVGLIFVGIPYVLATMAAVR